MFKCGNVDVMDLSTGKVFNRALLPVRSWDYNELTRFLERRVHADTNKVARQIAQHRRERLEFKLSLSDAYWISFGQAKFEDVSPYYKPFGTLNFAQGLTEPTLRLAGTFDKEWISRNEATFIRKNEPISIAQIEVLAYSLAGILGIGAKSKTLISAGAGGIADVFLPNISSPARMLLDFGSIFAKNTLKNGFNIHEMSEIYRRVGFETATEYVLRVSLFDTIIGNNDRIHNQGNWGFFKSSADGSVTFAPAYDFNMAKLTEYDVVDLEQRVSYIKKSKLTHRALRVLDAWTPDVGKFCAEHEITAWHSNFKRLYKQLT